MKRSFLNETLSELQIGKMMRWGVYLCCAVMLLGGLLYLLHHGSEPFVIHHYSKRHTPFSITTLFKGLRHADPHAVIILGFLILLLTQLVRVLMTAGYFATKKIWIHVATSLMVFLLLMHSIFVAS